MAKKINGFSIFNKSPNEGTEALKHDDDYWMI
jgi:hypothetical protein